MNRLRRGRVADAIREAELGTTGHIAVRIVPDRDVDALARAKEEFERAGLHGAEHRNASLILIAPRAHSYAVLGDKALHERVGDAFWQQVVDEMRPELARNHLDTAVLHAIHRVGAELRRHFPTAAP